MQLPTFSSVRIYCIFEDCGLDLAIDTVTRLLLNMLAMKFSDGITF
jgi:hypothetical protein